MPLSRAGGATLAVCLMTVLLGACGRRGPLEAPPDASAPLQPSKVAPPGSVKARAGATTRNETGPPKPSLATQPGANVADTADDEADEEQTAVVVPTPRPHKSGRFYTVPKEPFILDPLL